MMLETGIWVNSKWNWNWWLHFNSPEMRRELKTSKWVGVNYGTGILGLWRQPQAGMIHSMRFWTTAFENLPYFFINDKGQDFLNILHILIVLGSNSWCLFTHDVLANIPVNFYFKRNKQYNSVYNQTKCNSLKNNSTLCWSKLPFLGQLIM